MTNYDKIAAQYDFISRIVYGNAIVKAQVCLLRYIPANSRLLIVGGGTGWIIEAIAAIHSKGLTIDYVESSSKMIALSEKRNPGLNTINLINQPIENFITDSAYDVIITAFLFDNFSEAKVGMIFTKLDKLLKKEGVWLYADFMYDEKVGKWWQKFLLKLMYLFFRVTCNIETQQIVSMDKFFDPLYDKIIETPHYHNFIRSAVYRKL